jgi:hypothetical protein
MALICKKLRLATNFPTSCILMFLHSFNPGKIMLGTFWPPVWDQTEWIERLTANVKVATVLDSIPESSDTVESEERQMNQCWIKFIKYPKQSPFENLFDPGLYMCAGRLVRLAASWQQAPAQHICETRVESPNQVPQSTYLYRVQSSIWRLPNYLLTPPPPLHPASVSSPPPHQRRGGTHSPGCEGVGGQYFGRRQTLIWPLRV